MLAGEGGAGRDEIGGRALEDDQAAVVARAGAEAKGPDGGRRLLSGSFAQILQDAAWLGEQGVTELFYDLNWDPQIGSPSVDPRSAAARAREILGELAPG